MIYITGDTHGDRIRFIENNMGDDEWTEKDYLIVCGDFGFVFLNNDSEKEFLDFLEKKPYTICFCDGNHENFPAIFSYPKELWNGGYVHRIRNNVLHLMRGQVFQIDGKKIFTMGGAYSIDRYVRKLNFSYWKEELPNNQEYHEATNNLKEHNYAVDVIISHTAPREIIRIMGMYPNAYDMELTGFLEWIMYQVDFKHWYFGHWHLDETFLDKYTAVFYTVHALENDESFCNLGNTQ